MPVRHSPTSLAAAVILAALAACSNDTHPQSDIGSWGGLNFALVSAPSGATFSFWADCGTATSTTPLTTDDNGNFVLRAPFQQAPLFSSTDSATIRGTVIADSVDVYLTPPRDTTGSPHHYGGRLGATEHTTGACPG